MKREFEKCRTKHLVIYSEIFFTKVPIIKAILSKKGNFKYSFSYNCRPPLNMCIFTIPTAYCMLSLIYENLSNIPDVQAIQWQGNWKVEALWIDLSARGYWSSQDVSNFWVVEFCWNSWSCSFLEQLFDCNLNFVLLFLVSSIYGVHDEAKDKDFELEMSWICDESNHQHQKVLWML